MDGKGRFLVNELIRHFGNNLITGEGKQRRGVYLSHEGTLGFKMNFYLSKDNVDGPYLKEWYEHFAKAVGKKFELEINSFHN